MNKEREDQIYVRDVSSQQNKNGESLSDITMMPIECCPNRSLQLPLGQLRRIGILAGNEWTKEEPKTVKTPCHFVIPTMCHVTKSEKQDDCCNNSRNPLMIVEMIANKKDRKRVAHYLNRNNRNLSGGNPCIYYLENIKQYGFDHIIIIGECYAGLLFLDCYGRVFEWDNLTCSVLWPLGDYLNGAPKVFQTHRVIWSYEFDGTVVEFEDNSPDELTFDIPATVAKKKKKKKSKKKNSKKKQY